MSLSNIIAPYPSVYYLPGYLSLDEQKSLVHRCRDLGNQAAGFYTPTIRYGGKMHLEMMCLGWHWNAKTYKYSKTRSDHDGLTVQELPPDLRELPSRIAAVVGMKICSDLCIVNHYSESGRLGLHQDKDESPETLEAGLPVVSVSVGDTARFVMGGTRRKDPLKTILLESGDALAFGGPSRLRYHGVAGILPGTAPEALGMIGRYNLTFRQHMMKD
jgi:DNA alkylation damage repair protein AlkB